MNTAQLSSAQRAYDFLIPQDAHNAHEDIEAYITEQDSIIKSTGIAAAAQEAITALIGHGLIDYPDVEKVAYSDEFDELVNNFLYDLNKLTAQQRYKSAIDSRANYVPDEDIY